MQQKNTGFCDIGFAKIDTDRSSRKGFSEAIYSPGKTKEQLVKICHTLLKSKQDLLLTKLDIEKFRYLKRKFPFIKYNKVARLGYVVKIKKSTNNNFIAVISAGTSDIPIAEEAACVAEIMGQKVERIFDIGIAGVHRVMHKLDLIKEANVIIVVAGMEGALASLISGLVKKAIIAVPTSCGYGANFSGLAALLTMLNSCSPGISVVNIDNGFGAGYFASLINK